MRRFGSEAEGRPADDQMEDQLGLWSVVRHCRHARPDYPDGPEYRRLIVEYRTDGETITVELPLSEADAADLHERLISLEIVDEYLSVTTQRVHLTGRATIGAPARRVTHTPSWATPAASRPTIVVTPLCVDHGEF